MSGPESFLSRWSRRKAESAKDREVSPGGRTPGAPEAKPDRREVASPEASEAIEPALGAFDPASLPSIESVAAGADIRAFLQSGVPASGVRRGPRSVPLGRPTPQFAISSASPRTNGTSTTRTRCRASGR